MQYQKIFFIALIFFSCGRPKEDEDESGPPPTLKQNFSTDAENAGVGYQIKDGEDLWTLSLITRFKPTVRQGDSCREYLRFDFTPQKNGTNETSEGNLWLSAG